VLVLYSTREDLIRLLLRRRCGGLSGGIPEPPANGIGVRDLLPQMGSEICREGTHEGASRRLKKIRPKLQHSRHSFGVSVRYLRSARTARTGMAAAAIRSR
jgi:hypothetical protein